MTGAEIAALGWLASFLNTVLGGLTDRLKTRPSSERAREYAFELYGCLASLRLASASFVNSLRSATQGDVDAEGALREALADVSLALKDLERSLQRLEPQLEVHVPATAEEVYRARMNRAAVVSRAEESLDALARGETPADLESILGDAEQAQREIESATEGVRVFLAEQFSFKESF